MPERTPSTRGRGRLLRVAVACAVLLAVVAYVAVRGLTFQDGPMCTVRATGGEGTGSGASGTSRDDASDEYELTPAQAANAATIAAVASQRGLPERAVTIALATAMQESQLRNIGHGDRDSVGLFQQRPSQGWGTAEQIQDAVYSAGRFYDHLAKVPGYSRLPLTVAAQRVQRSGFPQAYAKHEMNATLLTGALTGRRPAALSCTTDTRQLGKPGDPKRVRDRLVREFGPEALSEDTGTLTATGPRARGSAAHTTTRTARSPAHTTTRPAAHTAARAEAEPGVTLPAHGRRRGWELAHWAVANAAGLHIERISYGGLVWSAARSGDGWREAGPGDAKRGGTGSAGDDAVDLRLATGH
ncbi:heavy metal transporter [Streptomyces oryzae]|uniref:Heavy metal transporter n=1 Tax=Streptomyces oryzae TaxID=1434886 RepID=A0ABS3XBG1_9ACTN|nr:heavy metal transporter [Streptomyces oryzae]MBO8192700.1 heavy metal transporter [Streptomyces oryzae]